jgi:DNA polymerase-3 subunit gamma/tau
MSSYISFYRKYRPKNFADVAGHKSVKDILMSEIKNNSVPNAMLFVGQKGTGKTSLAKILAKTLNCTNIDMNTCETCDQCENCLMAMNNSHPDIIEFDAASNNGVDEIRNIKANVQTLPTIGKQKVFIIDEVHMLTTNAFNAFLKTLEEPPAHVTFILATTELQKIPATILSRCQVFNFSRLNLDDVKERMKNILVMENKNAEELALNEIYYLSDGSLRDALNYLEQLSVISQETITLEKTSDLFSVATKNEKLNLINEMINCRSKKLIAFFERAMSKGLNVQVLILQLIDIVKEIIEFKITNDLSLLNYLDENDLDTMKENDLAIYFELADVFAHVYETTNRTNITYQYLLIAILKWINNRGTLISVVENEEENTPLVVKEEMQEIQEVQNAPVKVEHVEEEIVDAVNEEKDIIVESDEQKIRVGDEIMYDEKNLEIDTLKLISKIDVVAIPEIKFETKKILNVLVGAKKDVRQKWTDAFANLFQNGNLLDERLIVLHGATVVAACEDAVVIYVKISTYTKIINNFMQDPIFREKLFKTLNVAETNVFVINQNAWAEVKEVFLAAKNDNTLPTYDKSLFDNFYDNVIRHDGILTEEDSEILKRAKEFFGENFVKVVD